MNKKNAGLIHNRIKDRHPLRHPQLDQLGHLLRIIIAADPTQNHSNIEQDIANNFSTPLRKKKIPARFSKRRSRDAGRIPPAYSVKNTKKECIDDVISLGFHKQRDEFAEK